MANYDFQYGAKTGLIPVSSPARLTTLNNIKAKYGSVIDKAAANSNLPKELLYSLAYVISNGQNLTPYKTNDKLIRSGLFGLSQKQVKEILAREMAMGRMSDAEKENLIQADLKLKTYLSPKSEKGTRADHEHWSSDATMGDGMINDTKNPFNIASPQLSAQVTAIWLGQLLDKYGEQTNKPLDKAIVTMLLPANGWLSGNNFAKTRLWTNDYTGKDFPLLPKAESQASSSAIIAPASVPESKGVTPDVGFALRDVLATGGALDLLLKK